MRNGQVTPDTAPRVVPVVYIDLDISTTSYMTDEQLADPALAGFITGTAKYAGLQSLLLTAHGPGGNGSVPVYRIEGSLPQLVKWLEAEYGAGTTGEDLSFYVSQMFLAS